MRTQFEVWDCDLAKRGAHPCVLISHPDRCARAEFIDVLYCTSQRQSRQPYPYEIMLDSEDGMNWETFCDCSILWSVDVARLANRRGQVSLERRRAIRERIRDLFLLMETD